MNADEQQPVDAGTDVEVSVPVEQQRIDVEQAKPTGEPDQEWGSEIMLRFVRDLGLAYTAAKSLVKTSFVPQSYQGKPEEAAAAIVTGLGMGLDPLAALRSMDVIQGTPAFRALTIRAIVQSHGHEIWVEESNQQRAVVKGRRRGSDKVETSMWDMDRARRLKLTNKPNWQNQQENMLVARASAECGRLIAADALLGMAYSIEELEDGVVSESAPAVESKPRKTRTIARGRAVAPETLGGGEAADGDHPEATGAPAAAAPESDDPMQLTPEERAEYGVEGGEQP